jgi:Flp pilus assembly protein TadG
MKTDSSMESYHLIIRARRRLKGTRGHGLVEFAIVVPLFFLLMFGIIDMGHLYFVQVTLENAMRQAGRYAVTGASMPGMSRLASIVTVAKNSAPGLDISNIVISSPLGGSSVSSNGTTSAAGLPGENVTISLTTHLTLFTNLMGHYYGTNDVDTFTVSTTFRNEQFPYSQRQ